jgi:hypothetical protein
LYHSSAQAKKKAWQLLITSCSYVLAVAAAARCCLQGQINELAGQALNLKPFAKAPPTRGATAVQCHVIIDDRRR